MGAHAAIAVHIAALLCSLWLFGGLPLGQACLAGAGYIVGAVLGALAVRWLEHVTWASR